MIRVRSENGLVNRSLAVKATGRYRLFRIAAAVSGASFLLVSAAAVASAAATRKPPLWGFVVVSLLFAVFAAAMTALIKMRPYRLFAEQDSAPDFALEFSDTEVVLTTLSEPPEQSVFGYDGITHAEHSRGYFIILTGGSKELAFAENCITEGTPAQLTKLLHEKLGDRFRVRRK